MNDETEREARLDATFAALADPTRRAILARLAAGAASVAELREPFAMSQPAISKHLAVLERAGLVARGRDAQRRPRTLAVAALGEAARWLEAYRAAWEAPAPPVAEPSAASDVEPRGHRARGRGARRKRRA